jgi:hypothetical protein
MGRRSILDEGESQDDSPTTDESSANETTNETEDSSGSEEAERIQTTLRLPSDLADDLDDWADMRGMSRNAAVTYFIAEGLSSD